MNIAVDVMGGDHAPAEIVHGVLQAAPFINTNLLLVGQPDAIERHLGSLRPTNVEIVPAHEIIEMHEKPLEALRKKKDSSMVVAANLVKEGRAGAMVSAGNTGAATAASLLAWRQIQGIHRPAIGSLIPSRGNGFLLLDAGASPDVDPEHLVEFGVMARAYMEKVEGRENPRVHLLNIGEEEGKGSAFAKQAQKLLSEHSWFAGNIEGKDMFEANVDIVVCDAFVGNIVLKTCEGVAEFMAEMIRSGVPTNKLAQLPYLPMRKVMAPIRKKMDYAEVGGSPLLGLNGVCIIAHGRSNAKAIKNAILMAQRSIDGCLVDTIRATVADELPQG
ncbi:MAG: phosphate acyltransferase PlsX [Armatimonadetes bacterium]|nr:phosphate acyltransferase PlsX [Armatimonadota bacterium]